MNHVFIPIQVELNVIHEPENLTGKFGIKIIFGF